MPAHRPDTFLSLWNRIALKTIVGVHFPDFLNLSIEDPFVFMFHPDAVSIDQPLSILKHVLRNSYRQLLLQRSLQSLHEQVWRRVTLSR